MAAAASAAFAAPAMAQTAGDIGPAQSIQIPLSGTLAKACTVRAFVNGPFDALNLSTTDTQSAESVNVNCNYGGTASVTFASANNGELKSGSNGVGYKLFVSGSTNPFSSGVQLTTAQTWSGWPAVTNADQGRSISVALLTPATVAGTYTDTVTVSVQPN